MTTSNTDRVTKHITLRATPARVWRALSDAREFGTWFGVELRDDFAPGATVRGQLTIKGYEHLAIELRVDRMERDTLLAFYWHPHALDRDRDYRAEPETLVEIRLAAVADGTRVEVTESGFDQLPPDRRAAAFAANGNGWATQLGNLERHVA